MSMRDYIEHLKAKPEHVRRQVAVSSAAGVAGVVFLGWAVMLASSGTLALNSSGDSRTSDNDARPANAGLAGAAAAFNEAVSGNGTFTAVEATSSSTMDQQDTGEATVIPF